PEPAQASGDLNLDWLGGMPDITSTPGTPEAEPAQASGDLNLDWLGGMPDITSAPSTPEPEPAQAGDDLGLDWLSMDTSPDIASTEAAAQPSASLADNQF